MHIPDRARKADRDCANLSSPLRAPGHKVRAALLRSRPMASPFRTKWLSSEETRDARRTIMMADPLKPARQSDVSLATGLSKKVPARRVGNPFWLALNTSMHRWQFSLLAQRFKSSTACRCSAETACATSRRRTGRLASRPRRPPSPCRPSRRWPASPPWRLGHGRAPSPGRAP